MSVFRFLSPRLLTTTADGETTRLGGGDGPPILVAPRASASFERVELGASGAKGRRAARIRALQKAAGENVRTRVVTDPRDPSKAGVWTWSGDGDGGGEGALYKPSEIPEPLAYEPMQEGARVIRCIEGYEGQIWSGGAMVASRWWPEAPSEQDWILFLRHARLEVTPERIAARAPVAARWRAFRSPFDRDPENLRRTFSPATLAVLVGAVFCGLAAYHGARAVGHAGAERALKAQYETFIADNRPAMAERRTALASLSEAERIASSWPEARASEVVAAFLAEAPADSVQISSISLSSGEFLARAVQKTDIDHKDLVARLENSEFLEDVSIEIESNARAFKIIARTPSLAEGPS